VERRRGEEEEEEEEEEEAGETDPSLGKKEQQQSTFLKLLLCSRILASSPPFMWFVFIAFAFSASLAIVNTYAFILLTSLGASPLLLSLCVTSSVLAEIPYFYFAGFFQSVLGLPTNVAISLLLFAIRLLGYSVIQEPWLALGLESLQGIIFASFYSSAMAVIDTHSPPDLKVSSQGLFRAVALGVGGLTGAVVGGFVYDHAGPRVLFGFSGGGMMVLFLLWLVGEREFFLRVSTTCSEGLEREKGGE